MHHKRLSLRYPFAAIYDGRTRLSPLRMTCLPEVWLLLEHICTGEIAIQPPPGRPTLYRIGLPGGQTVFLVIGRPATGAPGHDCDLFVQDILWPEDLN